jgi:hypothetical protein
VRVDKMEASQIKGTYSPSEYGNFYIYETIGVPHPYCIGPRHVAHASDNFSGRLSKAAIMDGEKIGILCAIKGCNLLYDQHEVALVVACKKDVKKDPSFKPELEKFLKDNVDEATANNYAGFAFVLKKD